MKEIIEKLNNLFLLLICALLLSCDIRHDNTASSFSSDTDYSDHSDRNEDDGSETNEDDMYAESSQVSSDETSCPFCGGSGVYLFSPDGYSQLSKKCDVCEGTGSIDAATAKEINDYFALIDGMYDGSGGKLSGGNNGNSNINEEIGESVTQESIKTEIARHEQNIAMLESQLDYLEGGINRTQTEQLIIEEKYEIERLTRILNSL